MRLTALFSAFALTACAAPANPDADAPAPGLQTGDRGSITLEETPCFGFCPVYKMTLNSDGSYILDGGRHSRTEGVQEGELQSAAYDRAAGALREAEFDSRPKQIVMGEPSCKTPHTDAQTAIITWERPEGTKQVRFYKGCDLPAMETAVESLRAAMEYGRLIAGAAY